MTPVPCHLAISEERHTPAFPTPLVELVWWNTPEATSIAFKPRLYPSTDVLSQAVQPVSFQLLLCKGGWEDLPCGVALSVSAVLFREFLAWCLVCSRHFIKRAPSPSRWRLCQTVGASV